MRLTAIETQLGEIQCKLEESLQLFMPKKGRATHCIVLTIAYSKGEGITRKEVCILKGGVLWAQKEKADLQSHTLLDSRTIIWLVYFIF